MSQTDRTGATTDPAAAPQTLRWRQNWVTGRDYLQNDLAFIGGSTYIAESMHTSGIFNTDLAAGKWSVFAAQGTAGAGTGDMLAANNLSEVDPTVARTNLQIGQALQLQTYTAFTTTGGTVAFVGDANPDITGLTVNQRFNVTLNAGPTGSPTLAINGQTAKNCKYYHSSGIKQFISAAVTPNGWKSDVYYDGTDYIWVNILPPTIPAASPSYVVGSDMAVEGEYAASAVAIPHDDTIPLDTEGTQVMGIIYTASDVANIIEVEVTVFVSCNVAAFVAATLFKDFGSFCFGVGYTYIPGQNQVHCISFRHRDVVGTTSAIDYRVRLGANTGTVYFNGDTVARKYASRLRSSIKVTEYLP